MPCLNLLIGALLGACVLVTACSQERAEPAGRDTQPAEGDPTRPASDSEEEEPEDPPSEEDAPQPESDGAVVERDGAVAPEPSAMDAGDARTDASAQPDASARDGGLPPMPPDAQVVLPGRAITYQKHIRPVIVANCVECHTKGGVGPSDLSDSSIVKLLAPLIVNAVSTGRMPPWPASDTCHSLADSRALSDDVKALFAQWAAGGYLDGDLLDYVAPPVRRRQELGPARLVLKGAEPFTPGVNTDTYRCFYLGTVPADTYVTALDLIPGERAQVHHIQLHRVEPEEAASVESADQSAAGGGYPCNAGGAGVASQNMFSYRPGALAVVLDPGDAVYFRGGSGLVLQIHYNTQFLPAGERPKPDQSSVAMWTLPEGQSPQHVIYRVGATAPLNGDASDPFARFASIPANDPNVVGQATIAMGTLSRVGGTFLQGEIVGMTPHAHAWATRMLARFRPAGGAEQCLIDVPDWDFNWQFDYMYKTGVPYTQSDSVHIQCNYDNSAGNQPVINGMRTPVMPVTFGERTMNEMCLHYLWLRFPYAEFAAANR